jgi:hypothetical protein
VKTLFLLFFLLTSICHSPCYSQTITWNGGKDEFNWGSLCVAAPMFAEPCLWTDSKFNYGMSFYHETMGYAFPSVGTYILGKDYWWLADLFATAIWAVYYIGEDKPYSFQHFMATETGTLDHVGLSIITLNIDLAGSK